MKKFLKISIITSFILLFSACSQKENKISNPITDPVGHTADMVNLEQKMKSDINDSVNKENSRIEDELNK